MFPNDDICNVKAAKDAAKRIFNRYREPQQMQSNSSGLGEKQVSNLIKNAYQAINITYDPSANDVSSFMSVFGVGQDGKIDLGKIQEMAVKYLCGVDGLKQINEKKQQQQKQAKIETKVPIQSLNLSANQNMASKSKINQTSPLSFKTNALKSPQANQTNGNFLSLRATQSKYQFVLKQNVRTQTQSLNQHKTKQLSYQEIMKKTYEIFNLYENPDLKGVTIKEAPKILMMTYELIGRQKYNPTEDDVKIWMKLCDSKKTGIVDCTQYQNFVKRLLQRENIKLQS